MKAIKQLYDIKLCERKDENWTDMTGLILRALGGDKRCMHKRIVDDGKFMVNIYRDMEEDFFLLVISTDVDKSKRGVNVYRYLVAPVWGEARDYVYSGTLVKELMKDHGIDSSIALSELKEVLEKWSD